MSIKNNKEETQLRQQFFHNFMEVVDIYSQYPIAQHMAAFLRRKSDFGPDFFHWPNKELLNRLEQYKQELESEEIMNATEGE